MLNNFQPQAVLFDLDGTLVDSVPDLAQAIDTSLKELQLPTAGEQRVRDWVGNGARKLVERAMLNALAVDQLDPQVLNKAHQIFLFHYAIGNGKHSRLYEGVKGALDKLQQSEIPMAVVTNKPIEFVPGLLSQLGIQQYFKALVGGECAEKRKPSPLPLFHACRQLGVEPSSCLMIGDSKHDVQAAKAAGMPVVAVDYGYNHGEDIALSEPDRVVNDLSSLFE